jgi:hypothetical protein
VDVKETTASEVDFAKIGVEEALKILQVGQQLRTDDSRVLHCLQKITAVPRQGDRVMQPAAI